MTHKNKGELVETFSPFTPKAIIKMLVLGLFTWLFIYMGTTSTSEVEPSLANFIGLSNLQMCVLIGVLSAPFFLFLLYKEKDKNVNIYENGIEGYQADGTGSLFLTWEEINNCFKQSGFIYIDASELEKPIMIDTASINKHFVDTLKQLLNTDHILLQTLRNLE